MFDGLKGGGVAGDCSVVLMYFLLFSLCLSCVAYLLFAVCCLCLCFLWDNNDSNQQ